jgi:hypothetical protein
MEIEAHEFNARPFNSQACNECGYRPNHPVHGLKAFLGISEKPVWVDVGGMNDDRRECQHESFECSGPTPTVRHRCTDCDLCWTDNGTSSAAFVYCDICKPQDKPKFITKDSGQREEYDSGMKRDVQDGKPRFDLLFPLGIPYPDQFLTRVAELLARGAIKYDARNWEKATGQAELDRFKASAMRHLIQWQAGETDEDHPAAVVFNLMGAHLVEWKMKNESG